MPGRRVPFRSLLLVGLAAVCVGVLAWGGGDADSPQTRGSTDGRTPAADARLADDATRGQRRSEVEVSGDSASLAVADRGENAVLRVRVIDALGVPVAGAMVAWNPDVEREVPEEGLWWRELGRTDAEGEVRTDALPELLGESSRWNARVTASAVVAWVAGIEPVRHELPIDAVGGDVVLQLPPTGVVRVELPRELGREFGDLASLETLSVRDRQLDQEARVRRGFGVWSADFGVNDRRRVITFAHVGCDAELRFTLRARDNVPLVDEVFRGPTRQGEEVVLRLGLAATVVRGRLVDEKGAPLEDVEFSLEEERSRDDPSGSRFYATLFTDAAGTFGFAIGPQEPGRVLRPLTITTRGDEPRGGTVTLAGVFTPRTIDLGDVAVERLPVLATGRCVDDRGEPVEDASISVVWVDTDGRRHDGVDTSVRQRRLPDGGFELSATMRAPNVELVARAREHLDSDRQVVPVPAEYVVMRLPRAGRVIASARTSAYAGLAPVLVGDDAEWHPFMAEVGEGTTEWTWSPVRPGPYRFELRLLGAAVPLRVVDAVHVEPGHNRDPRLQDLPLDGVERFRVRFLDASGQPIAGALDRGVGLLFVRGDGLLTGRRLWSSSEAVVTSAQSTVELLVLLPGYKPGRATRTGGDAEIRLEPAPMVRVRVPHGAPVHTIALTGAELPGPVHEPDLPDLVGSWPGTGPRVPERGVVELYVPEPGTYAIEVEGVDEFEPRAVTVGEGRSLIEVELELR